MSEQPEIHGLKALEKSLAAIDAVAGAKLVRSALMNASTPMVKTIKANLPEDSGDLKKSISRRSKIDKSGSHAPVTVSVGAVKKPASWRAQFVEFGTPVQPPNPVIRNAGEEHADDIVARFAATLAKKTEAEGKQ